MTEVTKGLQEYIRFQKVSVLPRKKSEDKKIMTFYENTITYILHYYY